jgi:predicted SAM-dependent methyltransferase
MNVDSSQSLKALPQTLDIKTMLKPLVKKVLSGKTYLRDLMTETKRVYYRLQRQVIIEGYFSSNECRKLQVGGGANPFPGWLNTDLTPTAKNTIFLDATEAFPFGNGSFDYVFCEHMIEHISYGQAQAMLKECFRILKPGGKIRVSTPNLQVYLNLFSEQKDETQQQYLDWISSNWLSKQNILEKEASFVLNLVMHGWGHLFIYDEKTLKLSLEKTGFSKMKKYQCGESEEEHLQELESHGAFIGNIEMNTYETLIVEANKFK